MFVSIGQQLTPPPNHIVGIWWWCELAQVSALGLGCQEMLRPEHVCMEEEQDLAKVSVNGMWIMRTF